MSDTPASAPDHQLPEVLPEPSGSSRSGRWRLRALWGVLAAVAVGVGAVAVNSADDDPPRLPVALGAEGASKEAAMADMSMLANIVYVAGPKLPSLGDDAPAYRLTSEMDEATVRRLADALGLAGEPQQDGRLWRITDGQHTLELNPGMGASWWYGDTSATTSSVSVDETAAREALLDCLEPEDKTDVNCVPVTTLPTPADDLPSETEARRIALDLFEATGVDTDSAVVTVDGPYEGWYVNVEVAEDGLPTGLYSSVTVGPHGAIQWASGTIAEATEVGTYPTVDTAEAIERLNAGYGGFDGGGSSTATATDTATASSGTEPATDPATGPAVVQAVDPSPERSKVAPPPGVSECAVSDDGREICSTPDYLCTDVPATTIAGGEVTPDAAAGCANVPPAEPTEIVLDDATPILMLVGASDGSEDGYLVPGYRFTGADGVVVDQVAIGDGALEPIGAPNPGAPTDTTAIPTDIGGGNGATTPGASGGGSPGYDPDGSVSSPINTGPTPDLSPETSVPCTLPEPGPNGEVPMIGCAEAVPAG